MVIPAINSKTIIENGKKSCLFYHEEPKNYNPSDISSFIKSFELTFEDEFIKDDISD